MNNNLIFVQWTNSVGGIERITAEYENVFFNLNPAVVPLRHKDNGIQYKTQINLDQRSKILLHLQYFNFVRQNKNAIFHLQYTRTLILLITYLAGARRIIYNYHGLKFSNNIIDRIIWNRLQHKIKIIANSNHTRDVIKSQMGVTEDIEIIPNYINTNYFKYTERKFSNTKFVITYAGRFYQGKNVDILIETAKCLIQKDKNIQFRLYGGGPDKVIIDEKIKKYNLTEDVLFPGYTNDMDSVYKKSHLFLFLSSYESFGNVVAEAVLSGTPVLCHRIPALSELINDELFFVNNLMPEEIADKILFIKNNYDLLTGRLKIVHKKLIKYLDNCTISEKLRSIYNNFARQ